MGMIAENEDEKSHLAQQICDISTRAVACVHHANTRQSPLINWYLVLRVDENADINGIRKQYHKLALHLHPDKNKHSKAETAFKLVSEAYLCLSDSERRAAFDYKRGTVSCTKCIDTTSHRNTMMKSQAKHHQELHIRSNRTQMNKLRTRLQEEANIIEQCLLTNASASASRRQQALKNANGAKPELPVFNPSNYYQDKGPPRQHKKIDRKQMEDLRAWFRMGDRCLVNDRAMSGSPIFENKSERVPFMSRCATSSTRDS